MPEIGKIHFAYGFILYLVVVLGTTIVFRGFFSLLRALEWSYKKDVTNSDSQDVLTEQKKIEIAFYNLSFIDRFYITFLGFCKSDPNPDLWYNTIIGTLELLSFPILMKAEAGYQFIGAWIAFKALAQWSKWHTDRLVFNRFIIANALLILVCFCFLSGFVSLDVPGEVPPVLHHWHCE